MNVINNVHSFEFYLNFAIFKFLNKIKNFSSVIFQKLSKKKLL